jgi:hypothetical protein
MVVLCAASYFCNQFLVPIHMCCFLPAVPFLVAGRKHGSQLNMLQFVEFQYSTPGGCVNALVCCRQHNYVHIAIGKIVLNSVLGYKVTAWWVNGCQCVLCCKVLWTLYHILFKKSIQNCSQLHRMGVFVLYLSRMRRVTSLP